MRPLVSIIVPVYNTEKYLNKCIESIQNQDYKNLEIILVNDGSSDSSGEIIEKYQQNDSRIIVIHQENQGAGTALNQGLDAMTGEYVMFVDNDDWIEHDIVSFLLEQCEINSLDLSSCSGIDHDEVSGNETIIKKGGNIIFSSADGIDDLLDKKHFTNEAMTMKLYKTTLFDNLRLIGNRNYEDVNIFFKLYDRARRIGYYEVYKYHYLIRQGSICRSQYNVHSIEQLLSFEENYDLIKGKYYKSLKKLENKIYILSALWYIRIIQENKVSQFPDDFKHYQENLKHFKPIFSFSNMNALSFYFANSICERCVYKLLVKSKFKR
ncbi:MAG: glycosyltransferase [Anaerorhabdus sp.]